ncbi:bifunctional hydroxymethylpyrimidine kinase/phosphomethylpyrimidine kinase, partial [Thermodesulfobacteriota bacterium]
GAHALTAVTAITAQNSLGVVAIHEVPVSFISQQIETVIEDMFPNAVKTGMLLIDSAVKEVAEVIKKKRLKRVVVDPVIRASTGGHLLDASAITSLKEVLLPLARVVTPNLHEAGALVGEKVRNLDEMVEAAKEIKELGPDVVVTGGHLEGKCVDLLYDGEDIHYFHGSRIDTVNTHGSGCVFSASLATYLAMDYNVVEATRLAHDFTRRAIEYSYPCGHGAGVVSPSWQEDRDRQ